MIRLKINKVLMMKGQILYILCWIHLWRNKSLISTRSSAFKNISEETENLKFVNERPSRGSMLCSCTSSLADITSPPSFLYADDALSAYGGVRLSAMSHHRWVCDRLSALNSDKYYSNMLKCCFFFFQLPKYNLICFLAPKNECINSLFVANLLI